MKILTGSSRFEYRHHLGRDLLLLFLSPTLAILLCLAMLSLMGEFGRPRRYDIPYGFRGWIVIQYLDPKCPPLRVAGLFVVVPIFRPGCGCTSSRVPQGWRFTRYEYVREDGMRVHLPRGRREHETAAALLAFSSDREREFLFVGTGEDFRHIPRPFASAFRVCAGVAGR